MNKARIIVPALVVAAVGSAVLGLRVAQAAGWETGDSVLVQKLVDRFNLNPDDVQAVFDEVQTDRQSLRQERKQQRLDDAVAAGKLTEEQKNLILQKQDEIKKQHEANRENVSGMTKEDREAAIDSERESLQKWAEENNIDEQYLMVGGGRRGRGLNGPKSN